MGTRCQLVTRWGLEPAPAVARAARLAARPRAVRSPELRLLVVSLVPGQRTPVFLLGSSWDRYPWYLRLPCTPGAPWAGIVRLECSATRNATEAIGMTWLSQATLCRYASREYKDTRAPQNLYPIAGLERQLRRRLGDAMLLYRGVRQAGTHHR